MSVRHVSHADTHFDTHADAHVYTSLQVVIHTCRYTSQDRCNEIDVAVADHPVLSLLTPSGRDAKLRSCALRAVEYLMASELMREQFAQACHLVALVENEINLVENKLRLVEWGSKLAKNELTR